MKGEDLVRKLVLRSSDDLLALIYEQARWRKESGARARSSWHEIARLARAEGIFTEAEARKFLRLVSDEQEDAA